MDASPDREPHELPQVDRAWFPTVWLDEMNPPPQASPDAFIQRVAGGFELRLPPDDPEAESEFYRLALEPGQIVDFSSVDRYGDIHVIVNGEAAAETDRPIPPEAEQFYEHSTGALCDSFDDMVAELRVEQDDSPYCVSCYTWRNGQFFRFEVDADGARFVRCEGRS